MEFHGDEASLAIASFQEFDATVEVGPYDGSYEPVPFVRQPFRGTAWARGLADMAAGIGEGRPHRASAEQAAHVVDILAAAAASMAFGAVMDLHASSCWARRLATPSGDLGQGASLDREIQPI